MSWQDDLRQLDQALAQGLIHADDYRRRRDELLATASGAGGQAQQSPQQPAGPAAPAQPVVPGPPSPPGGMPVQAQPQPQPQQPQQQPPSGSPFAPAFRWDPAPDSTQVVGPPITPSADATQVVTGAGQKNPSDAERTQVVRPVGQPNTPPPGFQAPPWHSAPPSGGNSSPWNDDMSAPVVAPTPGWYAQGPEVFDEGSSSNKSKRWLIVAIVAVVLAGAAVGVFLIMNNKGGENPPPVAQTTQAPPSPTKTRPSDPNEAALEDMPRAPGQLNNEAKIIEVPVLAEQKLLTPAEVELLTAAGAKKVSYKASSKKTPDDGPTPDATSAMVIVLDSEASAEALVGELKKYQEANGFLFEKEPLPNMPPSVVFEKSIQTARATYRGLYVSGKNVIRMNSVQEPMANEAALSGTYRDHTEAMLKAFPAS